MLFSPRCRLEITACCAQAGQPSTTYGDFKRELLNEIARCLSMPRNVACGDSSAYNYASGRLDHQTYHKAIRVDQEEMAGVILDRVLEAWMAEAVLVADFLPQWIRAIASGKIVLPVVYRLVASMVS